MSEHASNSEAYDEARFIQLLAMFQMAAMQQMGKLPNSVTNETQRDLEAARASIDMLETIKRRTEGNRTANEEEFLGKILFELQMNYVDEVNRKDEEDSAPDEGSDGSSGEKPSDGPDDEKPSS